MDAPILVPMLPTLDHLARTRIKAWIASTGVTQTDLAERIGRNQSWMNRYLRGDFDADLSTLQKIAEVFGHPLTALLDLPDKDPIEAKVLEAFRSLSPRGRQALLSVLEDWCRARRSPRQSRR